MVCAVVDSFAKTIDHFSIYNHDGRGHGQLEVEFVARRKLVVEVVQIKPKLSLTLAVKS